MICLAFSSSFCAISSAYAPGSSEILANSLPSFYAEAGSLIIISRLLLRSSQVEGSIKPRFDA